MAAYVLWTLLRAVSPPHYLANDMWGTQFMRLAARIAINRTIAGVHFPVDSIAGSLLGLTLGQYFVARCIHGSDYQSWAFEGDQMTGISDPIDFVWHDLFDVATFVQTAVTPYVTGPTNQTLGVDGHSAALNWIWERAREEWR